MIRDHWNFTDAPFGGSLDPATFHPGAPQEEALARLEWLVEERQRFGLVVGAEGCGKSHLSAMAVRRLGGLGAEAVMLSLRGLSTGDWIDMLLERLPLDPATRAEPLRPWQKLENRLRENTLMERTTALVFDDVDAAPADALDGLERLVGAAEPRYARTVVVATATPEGLARVPAGIRRRAAVRIELVPWSEADVAGFLARSLRRVGGAEDLFSAEAVATLTRFAGGVPRVVGQLGRLALAAAAGDDAPRIDAATVERAWRELAPAGGQEPAPKKEGRAAGSARSPTVAMPELPTPELVEEDDDMPPVKPRVRVVRRLW